MKKMKVLVAVTDYPRNDGSVKLMYVHVRNKFYEENNIDVTVLNFSIDRGYVIDNINVISLNEYSYAPEKYDVLILHAANIRKHYAFLKKYGELFDRYVFFFHGHEVLKINKVYSKPYAYVKKNILLTWMQNIYDELKLFIWRNYFPKVMNKSYFVFVSQWMLDEFVKWTRIPVEIFNDRYMITYNCVGKTFEEHTYEYSTPKEYDFVTIRSNLDGSKYCIDIVNKLAKANPEKTFLLIGKGRFFEHFEKAPNITWRNTNLNHEEIIKVLQMARCALMPTRTDAQGLMMCEMATFGMPVITSDIPVCHEVFSEFENVALISNDSTGHDLWEIYMKIWQNLPYTKNEKYYNKNTSKKEVEVLLKIYKKDFFK